MRALEEQPLAEARGHSMSTGNVDFLADKLFGRDPILRDLFIEVLRHQEYEIRQLRCIVQLRDRSIQRQDEEIKKLRTELDALREETALERAYDRQRIKKLEEPAPALSQKTAADHLDRLFSEMHRLKILQVTVKDAARLLEISKRQMKDVKPYLADDSRFVVMKDPHHRQRHLIRIV